MESSSINDGSAESRRRYRSEKREPNGIGIFPTNTAR
jgi:hypothetical protein